MKEKKIIPLLAVFLIFFMTIMTTVGAETEYTTVNGQNEGYISVSGDLLPKSSEPTEETEESEEEPEKETPKPVVKPTDTASAKKDGFLPKTGESQTTYHILGLFLILGSLLMINRNKIKRKI